MDVVNRDAAPPFVTKDGSTIREILAYRNSVIMRQSLAEATVPPGCTTRAHFHPNTEEIYYILRGSGTVAVDGERRIVAAGDAVAIPPGAHHEIRNDTEEDLIFLCCCAPAYEHDDTVQVDNMLTNQAL